MHNPPAYPAHSQREQRAVRTKAARSEQHKRWKLQKKLAAQAARAALDPAERAARAEAARAAQAHVRAHLARALSGGLRVAVDLGFCADGVNSAREVHSLAKQLNYLYSALRRQEVP